MARKKNRRELPDLRSIQISPAYYAGKCVGNLLRWLFLLAIAFIILYPLLYMVSMAFRSPKDFMDITVVWLPKTPTWDNFRTAVVDVHLLEAMKNTVLIAVGSSLLQILVTCLAGYGFARFHFKGSTLLFIMVVFTIVVPPQLLGMPNYLLMSNFDVFGIIRLITGAPSGLRLLDSPLAVFLPAALGQGLRAGLFILVFRQVFAGIPAELEEAALIDGCGYRKTFFRIMLPNARTSLLVFFLFSLVWYWSDYYLASINLSSVQTLATRIVDLRYALEVILPREHFTVYYIIPIEQAACVFSIAPLILLFLVGQRFFVQGIDRTGIVG